MAICEFFPDTLKSLDVNLARNRFIIDNFGCINASVRCIFFSMPTIYSKLLSNLHLSQP